MRILEIALFMLIFNLAISLVNVSGAFPSEYDRATTDEYGQDVQGLVDDYVANPTDVSQGNDYIYAVGDFFAGLNLFISVIAGATIGVYFTVLSLFGPVGGHPMAQTLSAVITLIVYFFYATGLIQFVSNRSFKSME